jgi:hypothetical protein
MDPAGRFALGVVTSVMNGFAAFFAGTPIELFQVQTGGPCW